MHAQRTTLLLWTHKVIKGFITFTPSARLHNLNVGGSLCGLNLPVTSGGVRTHVVIKLLDIGVHDLRSIIIHLWQALILEACTNVLH